MNSFVFFMHTVIKKIIKAAMLHRMEEQTSFTFAFKCKGLQNKRHHKKEIIQIKKTKTKIKLPRRNSVILLHFLKTGR